jgi:hypothetical protein
MEFSELSAVANLDIMCQKAYMIERLALTLESVSDHTARKLALEMMAGLVKSTSTTINVPKAGQIIAYPFQRD